MEKVVEKLDNINKTLERQNAIIQRLLDIMPKPASRFTRILETAVLFASALGILSVIDVVKEWIIGG